MSETPSDRAKLAALIQEIGYRAQIQGSSIKTAMSGLKVVIFDWPGESIQMYFGMSLDNEDGFGLENANELNRSFRFIKCYVRADVVHFEQDFFFDVSKEDAKEHLERIFNTWEASISSALEALRNARTHYREQAEASADTQTRPAPPLQIEAES